MESSIVRLKLIRGFKSGDTEEIERVVNENSSVVPKRTLLHLAVQIASVQTIEWMIGKYVADECDINATDEEGNTALHLAAMYGRTDVALYLLSLPQINDTVVNHAGKQPVEVCKYPETAEAMQVARARYVEKIASQMKQFLVEENTSSLEELLSNPRASALLDINGQDPDTGSTVLHDFIRQKNAKMVEFILSHGGDPFCRDLKGVLPLDLAKDEKIRKLLKNATKEQPVINPPTGGSSTGSSSTSRQQMSGNPPNISGYLKKWTNFTGGYKLRWFVLENGVLSYYKKQDDTDRACRGSINMRKATLHLDSSEKTRFEIIMSGSSTKFHLKANHPVETNRWVWALTNAIQHAKDQEKLARKQQQQLQQQPGSSPDSGGSSQLHKTMTEQSHHSQQSSRAPSVKGRASGATSGGRFINQHQTSRSISGGFPNNFADDNASTAILVYDKHSSLIENDMDRKDDEDVFEEDDASDISGDDSVPYSSQQGVLEDTIRVELDAMSDLVQSLNDGEKSGSLSQESLAEGLETFSQSIDALRSATSQYTKQANIRERFFQRKLENSEAQQRLWAKNIRDLELDHERIQGELHKALQKKKEANRLLQQQGEKETTQQEGAVVAPEGEEEEESDDDDEFFDVEDVVEESKEEDQYEDSSKMTSQQAKKNEMIAAEESFAGYEDPPRSRLKMDVDDRPRISLWGILKNLIGKDMTRMTLPVSFNECTNLLQRSAEDMEYTDILDKASKCVDDASLRVAYVAAFAASSYSSTINRIAKPFNPILGETYEYARPDKGYRLFAEQVSHHPPIGAVIAESPRWDFYGESNVKSKFNGRSFDINPLGRWYVVLRPNDDNNAEELYSFRKVTSSVVGIITGSPVVDNYGDMEVINHNTGHKCLLRFKSRGWRGANAYEVKGTCTNPDGVAEWIVAGKWNDKIFAKKITGQQSDNEVDDENSSTSNSKKILLWQAHERPPAPFNLTPFAITLNALPDRLTNWLPPTDTRLRPDQRAMEEGRYDDASDDKHRVEEKQRAARRKREAENIEYSPVWFTKTKHPVTGDDYYKPSGDYWIKRKDKQLNDVSQDIF